MVALSCGHNLPQMVMDRVIPGMPNMHSGGAVQLPILSEGPSNISVVFGSIDSSTKLLKNLVPAKAFRRAGLNSEHTCTKKEYTQSIC